MGTTPYRIVIPTDVTDYRKLMEDIKAENDSEGNASPLKDETANIDQGVLDMLAAEVLDKDAAALKKQAETKIEARNALQKKTLDNERGWRKTLEGKKIKAIHEMGDWGYTVDTSPKAKPKKP